MADEALFEGGRWVRMRSQWSDLIDIMRPAPRLDEAVLLAADLLAAPHQGARRDVFMLECSDAAARLVAVVRDEHVDDAVPFVADFLAMLVLELARSRDTQ